MLLASIIIRTIFLFGLPTTLPTSSKTLPLVKYVRFEVIYGVAPAYDHSRRYRRRWITACPPAAITTGGARGSVVAS